MVSSLRHRHVNRMHCIDAVDAIMTLGVSRRITG
jgi:hypothetical protein